MAIRERIHARLDGIEDRLREAVHRFEAEASEPARVEFEAMAREAHEHAADMRAPRHPELAWVLSATGRAEHLDAAIRDEAIVKPDGSLIGINKFEQLDPHWSLALIEYLEHRHRKVEFGAQPAAIELDPQVRLAIAGDWGTGYWRGADTPAAKVAAQMQAVEPDWTIHLGDVYYAGTADEERQNLGRIWPLGRQGQLLLNSNHEMYSGGGPLFEGAMPALAAEQNQTSYWSAENRDWVVLGLDTAYFATDMYMIGDLGPASDNPQRRWLEQLRGRIGERKLIVLSHHQPVDFTGQTTTRVYDQVTAALQRVPDYWYWGHLHNGIVYAALPGAFAGRCIGHGAVPYGNARALAHNPAVAWYETQPAGDPEYHQRVLCGFVALELDGPELRERLIGEDGSLRWSSAHGR
jgi:hypothetical protein